jgi:serine/threonine-protein kinase
MRQGAPQQAPFDAATKALGVETFDEPEPVSGGDRWIGKRVGNYVVDRPLARGGMGSVYVARHPHLGREVAVKFLATEVSAHPELAARFLAEARVTASLNHPNIVEILDFGELDGVLYYAMELLRGKSLRVVMGENGRFTPAALKPYIEQICWALEAAHRAGIVHRDLKPANILVLEGEKLRIKLVDFGVAKTMASGPKHTRHGQVLGTATHMAPEQALGELDRVTPQSDLYSLGAIAYEMLAGVPVFQHESDVMLMVMHVRDAVRPLREHNPDIPEAVARVFESCLAKNPAERPASARELAESLSQALLAPAAPALPRPPQPADDRRHAGEQPTRIASSPPSPDAATQAAPGAEVTDRPTHIAPIAERSTRLAAAPPQPAARPAAPPPPEVEPKRAATTPVAPLTPVAAKPVARAPLTPTVRSVTPPRGIPAQPVRNVTPARGTPAQPARGATPPRGTAAAPPELAGELTAESTISTLLQRLQRRGDFPAFARTVGEVSQKADANGAFSAHQLGESILKDYALTAKLLRIVNANYARRFGGRIYSVQHAILILGFDRVRSLALSISLFKTSGTGKDPQRVSESAISALVSSEIARHLAADARVSDDEATVCAMFRNMGRHLILVYLPELYDRVQELVTKESLPVAAAATRVLGISFEDLGSAVAKQWQLPAQVIAAMTGSGAEGPLVRSEDRLTALSAFSNELCDIVTREPPDARERSIKALLARYKNLVGIDHDAVLGLLSQVEASLTERYSSLLGSDLKSSRFVVNVSLPPAPDHRHSEKPRPSTTPRAKPPKVPNIPGIVLKQREARIKLARIVSDDEQAAASSVEISLPPAADLEQRLLDLKASLDRGGAPDALLATALELVCEHLGVRGPLILTAAPNRQNLVVRFGLRDDIEGLKRELRFPLRGPGTQNSPFASAYHSGRDVTLKDAFAKTSSEILPPSYYEVLGSTAFALYACIGKGVGPALVLVDADGAEALPSAARVAALAELRPLIARAAARF